MSDPHDGGEAMVATINTDRMRLASRQRGIDLWVHEVATLNAKRVTSAGRTWIELYGTTAKHEDFCVVLFDRGERSLDAVLPAQPEAAD